MAKERQDVVGTNCFKNFQVANDDDKAEFWAENI